MQARGTVAVWHADEGWGVLTSSATPGGCWAGFGAVVMDGYRALNVGDMVDFTVEAAEQDGYHYRAISVWPAGVPLTARNPPPDPPGPGYRSELRITLDPPAAADGA